MKSRIENNVSNLFCRDCRDFNVLGFDCEWISESRPVALLQLATARGNIYLIRLCKIGSIPRKLEVIETDSSVYFEKQL